MAKDLAGNSINDKYESSSGFKTVPIVKWYEGSTNGWSSSGANPGSSDGGSSGAGGGCSYSYTRTTFQSGTKYIAQSLNPSISINPSYIGVGLTETCPDKILIKSDSGGSPNTTLKTITFSAITQTTSTIKDSSGNSYSTAKTCTTSISSSDAYTLTSRTTYWLVFEYTNTPTILNITDQSYSTTNSNMKIKHSTNGSSWTAVPVYNFTQENPSNCYNRSNLSYTKRIKLFWQNKFTIQFSFVYRFFDSFLTIGSCHLSPNVPSSITKLLHTSNPSPSFVLKNWFYKPAFQSFYNHEFGLCLLIFGFRFS